MLKATKNNPLSLSVVIPIFRAELTIEKLVEKIHQFKNPYRTPLGNSFWVKEIILVHDGASDNSAGALRRLAAAHSDIRLVFLTRNFGQHPATLAGISHTTGDWIVTLDEDGQHNPADLPQLIDTAMTTGVNLVYAKPQTAPHGFCRNALSHAAKFVFVHLLGNHDFGKFNSYRLIRGEIARRLGATCNSNIVYIDVALSWLVSRSVSCPVHMSRIVERKSGYNFFKLTEHFIRLLLSSGTRPLRLISILGILSIFLAGGLSSYAVFCKLTHRIPVAGHGWTSLVVIICLFSGLILFALGVIAEYIGNVLTATMGKPIFVELTEPETISSKRMQPIPTRRTTIARA